MNDFIYIAEQEQWLTSLENETFGQVRYNIGEYINGKRCYCCLGVANHLMDPSSEEVHEGKIYFKQPLMGDSGDFVLDDATMTANTAQLLNVKSKFEEHTYVSFLMNDEMREFLMSMSDDNQKKFLKSNQMPKNRCGWNLSALNDDLKFSFKQIAKFIRKFPHEIFNNTRG